MKKKIKTIKLIKNLFIENSFELSKLNLMKVDEATIKVIASYNDSNNNFSR